MCGRRAFRSLEFETFLQRHVLADFQTATLVFRFCHVLALAARSRANVGTKRNTGLSDEDRNITHLRQHRLADGGRLESGTKVLVVNPSDAAA